jgi:hypothetical protein
MTSIELIGKLDLQEHPEGGFFKETYRSKGVINESNLEESYQGDRNYSTCIYFLLTSEKFSAFHRIQQNEIWHFYDGSPIHLHMIHEEGNYASQLIGRELSRGEVPQFVVPGGVWFASEVAEGGDYSLAGCTVSPGFDFADFELKSGNDLVELFPEHEKIIQRLTHT